MHPEFQPYDQKQWIPREPNKHSEFQNQFFYKYFLFYLRFNLEPSINYCIKFILLIVLYSELYLLYEHTILLSLGECIDILQEYILWEYVHWREISSVVNLCSKKPLSSISLTVLTIKKNTKSLRKQQFFVSVYRFLVIYYNFGNPDFSIIIQILYVPYHNSSFLFRHLDVYIVVMCFLT